MGWSIGHNILPKHWIMTWAKLKTQYTSNKLSKWCILSVKVVLITIGYFEVLLFLINWCCVKGGKRQNWQQSQASNWVGRNLISQLCTWALMHRLCNGYATVTPVCLILSFILFSTLQRQQRSRCPVSPCLGKIWAWVSWVASKWVATRPRVQQLGAQRKQGR